MGFLCLKDAVLCPDQISDLADIAVGDPHLPKLKEENSGFSIIICRSDVGKETIEMMHQKGNIIESAPEDVINNRGRTLKNRKLLFPYMLVSSYLEEKFPILYDKAKKI